MANQLRGLLKLFGLRIGDRVRPGEPLFSVHAQSRGELEYALDYARDCTTIFDLQDIEP